MKDLACASNPVEADERTCICLSGDADAEESENIIGLISVKDIVKCTHEKTKAQMNRLEDIITMKNIADSAV